MELTAIIAGLLLAAGGLAVLTGVVLHARAASRQDLLSAGIRLAGELPGWLGRHAGHDRGTGLRRVSTRAPRRGENALAATLIVGLAAVALAAVAVGTLVDDVTDGDGVAVLDHPVARFVTTHRALPLTTVMKAVSTAGGPIGITGIALAAGLIMGIAWRSWTPAIVLSVTGAGVIGLTIVFKAVLGRARPPLAEAVAAADGFGFPSGHAATAAAVCGAAAWLCSTRMRSWRARTAVWAGAAMLTALVGISRVYLGVHWTTDVIGGWFFGILWMAVVISAWAAFGRVRQARS